MDIIYVKETLHKRRCSVFLRKFKERNKLGIKPEIIASVAQLSFLVFVILSRLEIPQMDFIKGILLGLSLTGNLAWLILMRKKGGE